MKKKVVVYGLGKEFKKQIEYLCDEYEIVAVSDRSSKECDDYTFVAPDKLNGIDYDFVYITSLKYYEEIRHDLEHEYCIPKEKIISFHDVWWCIPNSYTRDEWVKEKLAQIPSGFSILDAGAGNCRYKKYCSHLDYVSQDFGEYDDTDNQEGINGSEKWNSKSCDIISDIISIPVESESFDYILCTEVFEHIKNPLLALKEFGRILKPKGKLILTAPFCSLTHMAPYYYANGFSKYWYYENLKDNGFEIEEIVPNGNYFLYLAQEIMRLPEIAEQYSYGLNGGSQKTIRNMLRILTNLSGQDAGSKDILCFGFFIMAQKAERVR